MPIIKYLNDLFASTDKFTHENSIVICGAGISWDSKLPLGGKIVKRLYDDFNLSELNSFFTDISNYIIPKLYKTKCDFFNNPRLEVLFYCVKQVATSDEYKNYIYDTLFKETERIEIESNKIKYRIYPNHNHFIIANHIFNGGKCVTFNFDELLENAYNSLYGKQLNCCAFPQTHKQNEIQLIKAHGTFSFDSNQVFNIGIDTSNLYINGFSKNDTTTLSQYIYGVSNIIFIGYSVSDTLDMIPFLQQHYHNQKINFYFFDFDPSLNKDIVISKDNSKNFIDFFQFNHHLKNLINEFYYINYNPDNSYKHLALIPQTIFPCEYIVDETLLVSFINNKKDIVKLSVLENLSLVNKFGKDEIERLDKNSDFYKMIDFEKKNREGNYWDNSIYIVNEFFKNPSIYNYNRVFGILNEFFFLTPKLEKLEKRFFISFVMLFIWVSLLFLKTIIPNNNTNSTSINRNLYMPFFRFLRFFKTNNIFTKLLAKLTIGQMNKTIQIAIQNNNLKHYRFTKKDKIKLEYLLHRNTKKASSEILELITHNLDTNHFIDVTNLLKTKYEISRSEVDKKVVKKMAIFTNDKLNLEKLKNK